MVCSAFIGVWSCASGYAVSPAASQQRKDLYGLYAHYLKGYLLHKSISEETKAANTQKLTLALNEYSAALGFFKESSRIHLNMGIVSMALNNVPKAEELLKRSLELDADNLGASIVLALLYAHTKDEVKMNQIYEQFLKQAQRLQPENIEINEQLAQFYIERKNVDEAINVYGILLKAHPEYVNGYFWLGYLYEEKKNRKQAIFYWEKTVQMEPNHADALNCLGYLYAEEGIKLNEALLMLRKALELRPDEGAYLDSLGWVYYKQKDYSRAEFYLKKASEHVEDHVIYYHLGELYKAMQRKDEACTWWNKSARVQKTENPAVERITHECAQQQTKQQ